MNWRFRCPNLASGLHSLTGRPWASHCPWNHSHLQHKNDSSNACGTDLWCRVNENRALAVGGAGRQGGPEEDSSGFVLSWGTVEGVC